MKYRFLLISVAILFIVSSAELFAAAGGGKVRGDNGQGGVNQWQVKDPPPFEDD